MPYRIEPNTAPTMRFAAEISARIGPRLPIARHGEVAREFTAVTGGTIVGPAIQADILPGGGDWSTDVGGVFRLDARYPARTGDGVVIEVRNRGVGHADPAVFERIAQEGRASLDGVYFRTVPSFVTDAARYAWLADRVFVGVGREFGAEIVIHVFEVL